jgi:hypothetical protein
MLQSLSLDKKSLYAPGAMKAAYGTFLTSLLVIKAHDMVADQAATEFNVNLEPYHTRGGFLH